MFYAKFKRECGKNATRKIDGKTEFNPEYVRWLEDKLILAGGLKDSDPLEIFQAKCDARDELIDRAFEA